MKKIIVFSMMACLSLTFIPAQSFAAPATSISATTESAAASTLVSRLHEIKAMEISSMSTTQKKGLRKEVRSIQKQLSDIGGGVYISAGAVILILILLIILL
ncbi:MAG: hypothetical protein K9G49_16690 [Taibaiella sp.]|nr:hypothetical protein [Taibaiella sp.]